MKRVSRASQVNIEVECSHRMSVSVLRSRCTCTTQKIETTLFSHFTGFRNYTKYKEFLEFVLPNRNRSKLVYWGTVHAKADLVDTSLLFGTQQNKPGTQSGDDDDHDNDEDDNNNDNDGDDDDKKEKCGFRIHKLDIEDEFLLFMMRLRLGLSMTDLSFRFSVSEGTVSSIITTWLNFLFVHLGHLKIWPQKCFDV